jgi:hypothetical protein
MSWLRADLCTSEIKVRSVNHWASLPTEIRTSLIYNLSASLPTEIRTSLIYNLSASLPTEIRTSLIYKLSASLPTERRTSLLYNQTREERSLLVCAMFSKVYVVLIYLVIWRIVAMTIQRPEGTGGRGWEASQEKTMRNVWSNWKRLLHQIWTGTVNAVVFH